MIFLPLPDHIRQDLITASRINPGKLPGNCSERAKAIDEVVRRAKINYPDAFIIGHYRDQKTTKGPLPTGLNEFLRNAQLHRGTAAI